MMQRTIISLSKADKHWVDHYSHRSGQSAAETIRQAIQYFKDVIQKKSKRNVLQTTAGLWSGRHQDGLEYVEKIRQDWDPLN